MLMSEAFCIHLDSTPPHKIQKKRIEKRRSSWNDLIINLFQELGICIKQGSPQFSGRICKGRCALPLRAQQHWSLRNGPRSSSGKSQRPISCELSEALLSASL